MEYIEIVKIFGPLAAIALFLVWVLFIFSRRTADKLDKTDEFVRNELVSIAAKYAAGKAESNKIIEINTSALKESSNVILKWNN